jgi:deazaflavin-dependent oxidoreductase (nitroreductase family)
MRDFSLFGEEHIKKYEETGGKVGHDWNDTQTLILHTTGRKSGKSRKNPLIYGRDGNDYLIVASKGGAPDHPDWYQNLMAHPDTVIQVWGDRIPVTARTAAPEERARLWPTMTKEWPEYDEYQKKTERQIPLVVLSPRQ